MLRVSPGNILVIMGSLKVSVEGISSPEGLRAWVSEVFQSWLALEPSLHILHHHLRARLLHMLVSDTLLALTPDQPSQFKGVLNIRRLIPVGPTFSDRIISMIPPSEILPEPYQVPFVVGSVKGALVMSFWPMTSRITFSKQGFH